MLTERQIDGRDVVIIEGPPANPRGRLIWRPVALIADVDVVPSVISRKVAIRLTDRAIGDAISRFPLITEAAFFIAPGNHQMRSFAEMYHAVSMEGQVMFATIRG